MKRYFLLCFSVALPLAALAGCGAKAGPEMIVVKGEVKYAGQPVEDGVIRFLPIGETKGPASAGRIQHGRYEITARGGVPVGNHRVEIRGFRKTAGAAALPDGTPGSDSDTPPQLQFLPAKYNYKSTLEITIPPGNREITKDFDLTE